VPGPPGFFEYDQYQPVGNFPLIAGLIYSDLQAYLSSAYYAASGGEPPPSVGPIQGEGPPDLTPTPYPPDIGENEPTPGGTPNPGYENPVEPAPPDVSGIGGPPVTPVEPGPPVIFQEGPPVLYSPGPPPPPWRTKRGIRKISTTPNPLPIPIPPGVGDTDVTPPPRFPGDYINRKRRGRQHTSPDATSPPTGWGDRLYRGVPAEPAFPGRDVGRYPKVQFPIPRVFPAPAPVYHAPGSTVPAPKPDDDEKDRERPPLFPPEAPEEPANDTSIRRPPVPQVEPVRVPDPAGVRAPFPQPPPLPELPGVPPLQVPTPEVPTWPNEPSVPASLPSSALPGSIASPGPVSPVATAPPSPQVSQSPAVTAILWPLLGLLSGVFSGLSRFPGVRFSTQTGTAPVTIPTPGELVAPGLTPVTSPGVASLSEPIAQGQTCETPSQTRARRQRARDSCERFITVTIPRHKRRVCAAEAGKLVGRKIGKQIGKQFGKLLRRGRTSSTSAGEGTTTSKRRTSAKRRRESLVKVTRKGNIELPGGFGIEIPKQMRPPGLPRVPKL
jgi:hypothetical protein